MNWICVRESFRSNSDQLFSQVWFSKRTSGRSSIRFRRRICEFSERAFVGYFSFRLYWFWHRDCNVTILGWCEEYSLATGVSTRSIKLIMGSKNSQNNKDPMEIVSNDESKEIIENKIDCQRFADSRCVFLSIFLRIGSVLDDSHWKAAGYTDNQPMTAKNNWLFLQISLAFI